MAMAAGDQDLFKFVIDYHRDRSWEDLTCGCHEKVMTTEPHWLHEFVYILYMGVVLAGFLR